jgi:NTP pyrophosphatase (non-canonical NTP hydrolase)
MIMSEEFWEDFRALQDACYLSAEARGFHDQDAMPGDGAELAEISQRLMLIVSEVSEAMEELREDGDPRRVYYRTSDVPEDDKELGFRSELADVVIRVLDLAGALGLDLAEALENKMQYNSTRPVMHGGKHF